MALNFKKIWNGLKLVKKAATTSDSSGDLEVVTVSGKDKLHYYDGGESTPNSAIVTETHTAVLQNKSFLNTTFDAEGTGNTLSNIKNSNIKAAAAIDASKIANGTVSNTNFQYVSGVTSNIQAQIAGKADQTSLDTHTQDILNPHSVTKSQVGLSNVPNIDATLRVNHTGTQLVSTISDFSEAVAVFVKLDGSLPLTGDLKMGITGGIVSYTAVLFFTGQPNTLAPIKVSVNGAPENTFGGTVSNSSGYLEPGSIISFIESYLYGIGVNFTIDYLTDTFFFGAETTSLEIKLNSQIQPIDITPNQYFKIEKLADGVLSNDAVNKSQLDSVATGPYSPAMPIDWVPVAPTTVIEALNSLAANKAGSLTDTGTVSGGQSLVKITSPTEVKIKGLKAGTGIQIDNDVAFENLVITSTGGGGGSVAVKEEGSTVIAAAASLNFIGATVTVTDAGSSQADITITSSGALPSPTTFSLLANQALAADVTGLLYNPATDLAFIVEYTTYAVGSPSDFPVIGRLRGIYNATGGYWETSTDYAGVDGGFTLSITALGQVQYTSGTRAGTLNYIKLITYPK